MSGINYAQSPTKADELRAAIKDLDIMIYRCGGHMPATQLLRLDYRRMLKVENAKVDAT